MSQFFVIHPDNPQARLVREAAKIIQEGGVVIYPTDAAYVIGCRLGDRDAQERIRQLRHLSEAHFFTLVCRDLSELGTYAIVDNAAFKILKTHTPGPYTFILKATRDVPKRLLQEKRNTIGMRVPDNRIVKALLTELGEPLMSVSLISAAETVFFSEAAEIVDRYGSRVDLVIDGGMAGIVPTTVIDLSKGFPELVRVGKGDATFLNTEQ